jgi:hypothetical protein
MIRIGRRGRYWLRKNLQFVAIGILMKNNMAISRDDVWSCL